MSTERPDVAAAISSAAPLAAAPFALLPVPGSEIEHRVVDAIREADEEHEGGCASSGHREDLAGATPSSRGAKTAVSREQQRNARGDERAEKDGG